MRGISSTGKEKIKGLVERLFDMIAIGLLGNIPSLKQKNLFFDYGKNLGLSYLFLSAMRNRRPNAVESDVLKGLLLSSHGYIESLKHSTSSNVVEQVDGLIREAGLNGETVSSEQIQEVIDEQLKKAKNSVKIVAESESTKIRNVGSVMEITRASAEKGIEDPIVYFSVIRDKYACKWCIKNHLHENGTPRTFKLSEIKASYLSRSEKESGEVSLCGAHPMCRCSICYLSPGYGFKNGKLEFISIGHDEYSKQKS